jgi:23S rRNA A2030 N6-methylase RlmJ
MNYRHAFHAGGFADVTWQMVLAPRLCGQKAMIFQSLSVTDSFKMNC